VPTDKQNRFAGPSVWAWDRIIDFFINEFGDEPEILTPGTLGPLNPA
jgi:hypothetical protein